LFDFNKITGDSGGDALSGVVLDVLTAQIAPIAQVVIAECRAKLLDKITPAVPVTLRSRLETIGIAATEEQVKVIWTAVFSAVAADRAHDAYVASVLPTAPVADFQR
jgi:hypothetical protein